MPGEFFDSHCHFDFEAFDPDRTEIWRRCQERGLTQMVVPGVAPEQWAKAATLSREHPGIYHAAGLHPWWLKDVLRNQDLNSLRSPLLDALQQPGCVAVGECGLDLLIDTPQEHQEDALALHLDVAREVSLPIIIHNVRAHNPLLRLLKAHPVEQGGVIHAFTGSLEMAQEYWKLGFYLGVGGTITYERAHKTREALRRMPLEALLLETDAPDMPLCGHQGERNSPERIPAIAQALAELHDVPLNVIAEQTTANARRLFKL
ncbi:TatD family hydrolase [Marinimicrobium sp. ABcell2]|uniref:TatD family hydrolase n=1 Tax=Marinimicrobium sp. ABcell2 TaxID=3069751 RepID=UPI0027B6C9C7|nr:TatD family hydrolase [Marinimicrobium sp. ABcell2]MDQ2076638.1 TatD family hydrolase [Marinimicrobium sp. ABcell2]